MSVTAIRLEMDTEQMQKIFGMQVKVVIIVLRV